MFIRLIFSQEVAEKLVDNKGIDSNETLASLFENVIKKICDVIKRPGGLVNGRIPDRGNKISVLLAKNLKLAVLAFEMM